MKKICYIVTIPGTIEAFFVPQLKYLSENNLEVYVICSYDKTIQSMIGDKVKYIPVDIPRGISFLGSVRAILELKKVFKNEKFDLIQYSTPNASLYAAIASKLVKCKIRNYHCMGFRYLGFHGLSRFIFKVLEKLTCYLSTNIECVSKSNLEWGIRDKLFSKQKATVIFNGSTGGVDLNKFNNAYKENWKKEIRCKHHLNDNDFVYGFVGRITRDKGINELLEAFLSIENGAKLLMVGEYEDNNNLDCKLLEQAEINKNIIWAGKSNLVEKYYAAMDVLILPSYREGFGNVVIESEAMGTPVIVSEIPGPTDASEQNRTALWVKPKNSESLKQAMKYIMINPEKRKEMGNYCVKFVRNNFDEKLLNEEILKRKRKLLDE